MIKKLTIRQFVSLGMILVMLFSITPKKTIHELFACHQEPAGSLCKQPGEQVGNKTFHCSCDQSDFQSPYIGTANVIIPFAQKQYQPVVSLYNSALFTNVVLFPDLRGPPALA